MIITVTIMNMMETLKEYRWVVKNGINLEFIKEPMINTNSETDDVILKAIQQAVLVILTAFAEKRTFRYSCAKS